MAPVFSRLHQLGIEPMKKDELQESNRVEPLVNRIKRAAEKIRRDWAKEQMTVGENREHENEPHPAGASTEHASSTAPVSFTAIYLVKTVRFVFAQKQAGEMMNRVLLF